LINNESDICEFLINLKIKLISSDCSIFCEFYHVDVLVNKFQVYISYTIEVIQVDSRNQIDMTLDS
jgi:hypothetical protein